MRMNGYQKSFFLTFSLFFPLILFPIKINKIFTRLCDILIILYILIGFYFYKILKYILFNII